MYTGINDDQSNHIRYSFPFLLSRDLQEEIYRGQALFQEYPRGVDFPWKVLLEPSTKEFFTRYPRYIQVQLLSCKCLSFLNDFYYLAHIIL